MKHEVTTLNKKKMLSASLKHCMEKKSLSKITVTDIVTDCGLNRKTFYYHFQDVPDLLKWTLEQEAVDVVKQFDLLNELEEALRFAVRYIRENSHMINCAYDSIGRDELKRFLNHDFQSIVMSIVEQIERKENVHTDPDAKKIICNFYTEGHHTDGTVQHLTHLVYRGHGRGTGGLAEIQGCSAGREEHPLYLTGGAHVAGGCGDKLQ